MSYEIFLVHALTLKFKFCSFLPVASVEYNPGALHPVLEVGYRDPGVTVLGVPVRGPAVCLDVAVLVV